MDRVHAATWPHAKVASQAEANQSWENNALFHDGNVESSVTRTLVYADTTEGAVFNALSTQATRGGWQLVTNADLHYQSGIMALFSKKQNGKNYGVYINRDPLRPNTIVEMFTIY